MTNSELMLPLLGGQVSQDKVTMFVRGISRFFRPDSEDLSHLVDGGFEVIGKVGELELPDGSKVIVIGAHSKSEVTERVSKKHQYEVSRKILRQSNHLRYDAGVFFFYDASGSIRVSLIYAESDGTTRHWSGFKRFTYFVAPNLTNKTFISQVVTNSFNSLQNIKDAFSIAAVTDIFYTDFYNHFQNLVDSVTATGMNNELESKRDFVLLFAIRTIFIGFVQKKKWVGEDENFLSNYLKEYQNSGAPSGTFYASWLKPLFFQSLNTPSGTEITVPLEVPQDVRDALRRTPYLNGGLFKEKAGYDDQGFSLEDSTISNFFDFLFSHSFTIEENSRVDEDLQLNPEFLGIIFERIVNKENGAVYTPRTEVDFMCRMSLLEWITQSASTEIASKNIFELVFPEQYSDDDQKYGSFSKNEAVEILTLIESVAVCDPAVGSGAFLVGMLQVIDDVEQSLQKRFNLPLQNVFLRKKQIIRNSLYGVDIKEWAVWICQLRLWLSLFIEAEDELKDSSTPILPSLDFKVRAGDSLVQQVGSVSFPISTSAAHQEKGYIDELSVLQEAKKMYFENDISTTEASITQAEIGFYANITDRELANRKKALKDLGEKPNLEISLFGEHEPSKSKDKATQNKIATLKIEIANLEMILKSLSEKRPFVWAIEFAEVFISKGGFDIVIGNPPYVRQEKIEDPYGKVPSLEYKRLLKEMCLLDFPKSFAKNPPSAKSDLYVYFYIRSLKLLNQNGVHVFICSNSWLDVEYGARLQEFILKDFRLLSIIDNHARRSFSAAAVNTVISMISARTLPEKNLARFVGFKRPFEEVTFSEILSKTFSEPNTYVDDSARVVVVGEQALLTEDQSDHKDGILVESGGEYKFSKWGSKYLSLSSVLHELVSKDNRPIRHLFDFVSESKRNTLEAFSDQKPLPLGVGTIDYLKSVKDASKISLEHLDLKHSLQATPEEIQRMRRPDIISNRFVGERFFFIEGGDFAVSDTFFVLTLKPGLDRKFFTALMNSTISILSTEVAGRKNMGDGVLLIYGSELRELLIPNPDLFDDSRRDKLLRAYERLSKRPVMPLFDELGVSFDHTADFNPSKIAPDRYALDSVVFEALELSQDDQLKMYEMLIELVSKRLTKSQSV
jgi:hypothetical protein